MGAPTVIGGGQTVQLPPSNVAKVMPSYASPAAVPVAKPLPVLSADRVPVPPPQVAPLQVASNELARPQVTTNTSGPLRALRTESPPLPSTHSGGPTYGPDGMPLDESPSFGSHTTNANPLVPGDPRPLNARDTTPRRRTRLAC